MIGWFVKKRYFRNENHAIWFFYSIGTFVFTAIMFLRPNLYFFLVIPFLIHLSPFLTAIFTISKKKKSHFYLLCRRFGLCVADM